MSETNIDKHMEHLSRAQDAMDLTRLWIDQMKGVRKNKEDIAEAHLFFYTQLELITNSNTRWEKPKVKEEDKNTGTKSKQK